MNAECSTGSVVYKTLQVIQHVYKNSDKAVFSAAKDVDLVYEDIEMKREQK